MAVNLSPIGGVAGQFFDNNGNPLAGGKIFTYAAGTTTDQATYTSASGAIAHTNPIILDSAGRVPSGEIWLTDGLEYKFVIKDNVDASIGTFDNIIGINSNFVNFTNKQEIQTATAGQTVFTLTTMQYQVGTNSLSVFVDGVNQYGPGALFAYVETNATTITFTTGLHVGAEVKFTTSNLNSSAGGAAANVSFTGFKGQVGNVADIADNDGSDWIGFEQAGTGAVAISAQDKMRQIVSVLDFGADPTGNLDSTLAIQNALNYAATIVQNIISGKVDVVTAAVYLPAGRYKTTAALNVGEGVTFYGESQSTAIIKPTHTGNAINMGDNTREYSQIRVCNLGIIGNRSGTLSYGLWTTTTNIGIYAENCIRECVIENCFITQCDTSIKTENSYAFQINQCYMIYALSYHIHADNAVNWTISGNRIDWSEKHGIYLNGTNAGDESLSTLIQGNSIQLCWRNGIWLYDCSSATIADNFFEGNYREAVAATYTYADINIEDGAIAARTYAFNVSGNFFTHGSSPNLDVYTAVKCNKASSLNVTGNTCRDSFYRYFIFADYVDVKKIVALGNALEGTFTNVAYNSATTFGLIEEQIGNNVVAIPKFFSGSTQYGTTVSSSNQTSNEVNTMYLINCSGGNRQLNLRDVDCVAGRIYTVKKTDGGAVNFIRAIPESGSTKTIDGAANVSSTAAYAVIRVVSDGSNWFTI